MKYLVLSIALLGLAGCGADGFPIRPSANIGVSIGPGGITPTANVGASAGPVRVSVGR